MMDRLRLAESTVGRRRAALSNALTRFTARPTTTKLPSVVARRRRCRKLDFRSKLSRGRPCRHGFAEAIRGELLSLLSFVCANRKSFADDRHYSGDWWMFLHVVLDAGQCRGSAVSRKPRCDTSARIAARD